MVPQSSGQGDRHWYVLNFIRRSGRPSPQKEIEDFNKGEKRLELFAPIIRPAHIVKGKVVYRDQLLTYYYVFVNGVLDDVKKLCSSPYNDLSMMLDRGSERRYGILSDQEMENFKIISRAHTNTIPFFNISDIDLEAGDEVEVVSGEFAGLRGTYLPKPRSAKGNLVIAATAQMGAVLWDVDAKYIRILQFARDTRRQYDILESFIPKLFPILRKYHAGETLTEKERSILTVFNQRMCVVSPSNQKLEAKLLATLMCVQTILGDVSGYRLSSARFEKLRSTVTNPWTKALIELLLGVSTNEFDSLRTTYELLKSGAEEEATPSKSQRELLTEYDYYLDGN